MIKVGAVVLVVVAGSFDLLSNSEDIGSVTLYIPLDASNGIGRASSGSFAWRGSRGNGGLGGGCRSLRGRRRGLRGRGGRNRRASRSLGSDYEYRRSCRLRGSVDLSAESIKEGFVIVFETSEDRERISGLL